VNGIELIAAERKRQIEVEGFRSASDDHYKNGELAIAASRYAMPYQQRHEPKLMVLLMRMWPWSESWWKPTPNDRIRELAKAGALIAAEIDRLQREANSR
jgi:hypothetical protein